MLGSNRPLVHAQWDWSAESRARRITGTRSNITCSSWSGTSKNQSFRRIRSFHYPQVLFSLLSGTILSLVSGDLCTAELPMLYQLFRHLAPNDILIGDRGFGNSVLLALLQHLKLQVDFLGRSARRV